MSTQTPSAPPREPFRRQNRWALGALVRRTTPGPTRFAVDLGTTHSTVFDALSGRRDVSEDLLERMAEALDEDVRAISSDPYGLIAPLMDVLASARLLLPTLNGGDLGLRDAIAEVDRVLETDQ